MIASERSRPELLPGLLRDLAAGGKLAEIAIHGTSMCPTLRDGERVWLVQTTASDARIGDLLVWRGESGSVVHRLVGWWLGGGGWRLLTKGDALPLFDPPIRAECLLGRVIARVRGDQVEHLEGKAYRLRSAGRALASLLTGLMAEAWIRVRRAVHRRLGWPPSRGAVSEAPPGPAG